MSWDFDLNEEKKNKKTDNTEDDLYVPPEERTPMVLHNLPTRRLMNIIGEIYLLRKKVDELTALRDEILARLDEIEDMIKGLAEIIDLEETETEKRIELRCWWGNAYINIPKYGEPSTINVVAIYGKAPYEYVYQESVLEAPPKELCETIWKDLKAEMNALAGGFDTD